MVLVCPTHAERSLVMQERSVWTANALPTNAKDDPARKAASATPRMDNAKMTPALESDAHKASVPKANVLTHVPMSNAPPTSSALRECVAKTIATTRGVLTASSAVTANVS